MNENAKRWVEALRSGEFSQAQRWLRRAGGYCCLGVAAELYRRDHPNECRWAECKVDEDVLDVFIVEDENGDGETTDLPARVESWLGLASPYGSYIDDTSSMSSCSSGRLGCLTKDNDGYDGIQAKSFSEIADIIESEPRGLFS